MEEALAPQAHDIATDGERGSDLVIGLSRGGKQDNLGAEHFKIRQRIFARASLQDLALVSRETDRKRALSWHSWRPSFDPSREGHTLQQ
jgi:hypothetical protein